MGLPSRVRLPIRLRGALTQHGVTNCATGMVSGGQSTCQTPAGRLSTRFGPIEATNILGPPAYMGRELTRPNPGAGRAVAGQGAPRTPLTNPKGRQAATVVKGPQDLCQDGVPAQRRPPIAGNGARPCGNRPSV